MILVKGARIPFRETSVEGTSFSKHVRVHDGEKGIALSFLSNYSALCPVLDRTQRNSVFFFVELFRTERNEVVTIIIDFSLTTMV